MSVLGALYMAAPTIAGAFQARAGISGASWAAPPYIELAITSLAACWLLLYRPRTHAQESLPRGKETGDGR
ncbi:MAG TPA: hypothetical protein VLW50_28765 [Streptosporangiaceae bacterium]|nr:hypothetical protein [Streptosporangiaceae bacterium]